MPKEDAFVTKAFELAKKILPSPQYEVRRSAPLLYQINIDNKLEIQVDVKKLVRGKSSFETDLCVFEKKSAEVSIPRVVLEFKTKITTHDVLTYSAKALKHKRIYPYLRYGMVASQELSIPGRLFTHNEALDFFVAVKDMKEEIFTNFFTELLKAEIKTSQDLERIVYDKKQVRLFRTEVVLKAD